MPFHCRQCGRCCQVLWLVYGLDATNDDMCRWVVEGREDILAWVDDPLPISDEPEEDIHHFNYNPRTGAPVASGRCHFLKQERGQAYYRCRIYATRPDECRAFPGDPEHGARVGCQGIWND